MLTFTSVSAAFSLKFKNDGIAIADNIAKQAITITNSINEKP